MHQRLRRFGPWVLVGLASLLFMGCTQILNLIEGATGSTNTTTTPPVVAADSIRVVISELSANMVRSTKFSPAQANVVAKSAQDYVTAANVSETDFAEAIPVAVAGAEAGLTNANFTEQEQIDAVGVITTSFMNSLKGRFEVTSRSSRALAANAQVVSTLLARISQAAVKNLAKTGITSANLGQTAGAIVGNMITGLNGGGVNKALVSEALAQITQSAVATLKESGLTTTEALGAAVQAVTKGAVSAVATISVEGVSSSDFPALTSQITQGASESLGKIASSAEDVAKLVKSVATGSSEGIVAVAKTSSTVTAAQLSSMVQSATSGTTTGVMKSDFVNASQDAAGLIGNITEATSASLASTANTVAALSQSEIQKAVTIGASSAAQTAVPNGGLDAAALASAIILKDAGGATVAAATTDITAGVSLGSNTAPVIVVADVLTVTVGSQVNLDASATTDDKDSVATGLAFAWTVATKPQGAPAVTLSGGATAKASFLPTVVGSYLITLKVTDSVVNGVPANYAMESEQFVWVYVLANAGSATYGGKTAETRLADAKLMGKAGDVDLARDELLVILGHYPESTLTPEIHYWLSKAYQNLGDNKSAFAQFEKTIAMTEAATPFGARARVDYAGSRIWKDRDTFDPKPYLDEVVAALPNDPIAAEAKVKLASLTRNNGRKPDGSFEQTAVASCISQLQGLLAQTAPALTNEARFDAQSELSWSYVDAKNLAQASVEFLKLPALAQNNGPDSLTSVNMMRFNAVELYWWFGINFGDGLYYDAAKTGLVNLSNDPSQDANLRLQAVRDVMEYLIWSKPAADRTAKAANLKEAADLPATVLAATLAVNDSKTKAQRTWVYTRVGNANDDLRNQQDKEANKPAITDAAMAAYKKAKDIGWGHTWGYRPAGEAMVNLAGDYIWNKGDLADRHNLALALVEQVLAEHPADGDQWAKAYAQYRQGEIYVNQGNQQRDQNGSLSVYGNTYNKAVVAFSRVSRSLFPTVDPNEWFFRDSVKQIGECYANMRQYAAAESYFNLILKDTGYKPEDKVWIQLSLANALAESFMQLVQDSTGPSNVDSSNLLWTTKVGPAYDAVETYRDANDGTKFIKQGEPWAHALLQKGRYLKDAANRWRWDHGQPSPVWTPLYQKAAEAFRLVTPATFGSLPSNGWEYNDAIQNLADCGFKLGVFADGRAALNGLLALMDGGTVPNGNKWGVLKELVNSYRDEANSLGDGLDDNGRIPFIDQRVALDLQSVDQALVMYDKWKAETTPTGDATSATAWVLTDSGWSLTDAANTLGWDHQSAGPGQRGYTTADWTKIAAMETQILDLLAKVKGTALETANGGASIGRLNRILGHWYQDNGNRMADDTQWSVRKANYTKAWDYFQACITNGASEPDDVAASQRCQVGILSEYARHDYDPAATSDNNLLVRTQAFEDAIDLAALVVVNTGANRSEAAWACITMGQLYRDLHSSHAVRRDQLGGVGITAMDGPNAWQQAVLFWVDAIANKTGPFLGFNDGGPIQEAQRLVNDAKNGGTLNVTVQ